MFGWLMLIWFVLGVAVGAGSMAAAFRVYRPFS
jgi:hypothetical protein